MIKRRRVLKRFTSLLLVATGLPALSLLPSRALAAATTARPSGAEPVPQGGQMVAMAYDFGSGSLLKTSVRSLYRESDGGGPWQDIHLPALGNAHITGISTSPAGKGVIYLATAGSGVFRSGDDGRTWSPRSAGLPNEDVISVAAHTTLSDTVYAVVRQHGIYRSQDAGKTWRLMDHGPAEGIHELIHSNMPGSMQTGWLFAATPGGVERIMDCFCLWEKAGHLAGPVQSITYAPGHPKRIYAATEEGLFRSADGGQSWVRLHFPNRRVTALAAGPAGILYAISAGGKLFRSVDQGSSWARVNE